MHKQIVFLVLSVIIATFIFLYTPYIDRHSNEPFLVNPVTKGTIIILNGVSSAGKTTIQKELQDIMTEPYLAFGVDKLLINTLPKKYVTGEFLGTQQPEKGVEGLHGSYEIKNGQRIYKLIFGPTGRKLIYGWHKALVALADEHNNLIVDYILYNQDWLSNLVNRLYGYRVYFVGIKAPIDIIEQRERKRGTSPVGHARAYYDTVHKHGEYDIIIDTADLSPQDAATAIKEFVEKHPQPKAFNRLYKRFFK